MKPRMDSDSPFAARSSIPGGPPAFKGLVSIRLGFLRLLALLLAIALVSSMLLVRSAYQFARDQAKHQILDTTRALSRVVDGQFARYDATLRALAASPSVVQQDWRAVADEARNALPTPDSWITLTDRAGRRLVDTRPSARRSAIGEPKGIDLGKTHICDLQKNGADPHICVHMPIMAEGHVAYILSLSLPPTVMSNALVRQQLPADWRETILDSQGTVVWRSRFSRKYLGRKGVHIMAALKAADEGIMPGRGYEGKPVYVAFSRSPASHWVFIIAVPRSQLDAGIWPGLTGGLATVAALLSIGAIVAALWMRRFAGAIELLAEGAGALARRTEYRQPETRILELNDIATALGEADQSLRQRDQDLQQLNASLSQRVEAAVMERETALAQLHEARKLETLGQLTGGVAHDLNNLLSPIISSLEILQTSFSDDARNLRLVDAALTSSERAKLLVARLLSFSRRQTLRPRTVDVAAMVEDMADLVQRSLGSSISVRIDPGHDPAFAHVDASQLELALLNLAVNARDAMSMGGTLTLIVRNEIVGRDRDMAIPSGHYVRLSVIDSGGGMDEATRQRAVDPFFSTKAQGQGTGLGLSMVHGLAVQSGGAFMLESAPGEGTRADIWLPVSHESPVGAAPDPIAERKTADRILLVDDDDLVRGGTAEMLIDMGFALSQTGSPVDALAMIRAGMDIDCLVTDYRMPRMNGAELIVAARETMPHLAVVLVTGFSGQDMDLPAVARLEKPFRQKELKLAIATAIGFSAR